MNDAAELPRAPGVYKITHRLTGDFYVGSSRDIRKRGMEHIATLISGLNLCGRLQRLASLHGVDFDIEVLEITHSDHRLEAEKRWIAELQPTLNVRHNPGKTREIEEARRKVVLGARIDPELRDWVEDAAASDERTVSYMVEKALQLLREHMTKGDKKPRR
jgi:group I intron endonuclease